MVGRVERGWVRLVGSRKVEKVWMILGGLRWVEMNSLGAPLVVAFV